MKKILCACTILLLTICLCACGNSPVGTPAVSETTVESVEVPSVEIPPDAITLSVSFGPEFEIVMTDYLRILTVVPANSQAQALLEGLALTDRCYLFAFGEVLAAARDQDLLKVGVTLKMEAESQDTTVWNNATKELLMRPVEAFRAESGLLFSCYTMLPDAAEPLDLSQYTRVERTTEEFHQVSYPTGAVSGHTAWRSVWTYPDGRTMEWYAFSIREGSATISTEPGGRREFSINTGTEHNLIWEGPESSGYQESFGSVNPNDGNFVRESSSGFFSDNGGFYFTQTYNTGGALVSQTAEFLDGSREAVCFFENGEISTREYTGADGSYESVAFFENGQVRHRINESAEGYYEEQFTQDGAYVYRKFADAGMTNVREVFYTDGQPVKAILDGVVHEDRATLSLFG